MSEFASRAFAWCRRCNAPAYSTRKQARTAARIEYPGLHLTAVRCSTYWHLQKLATEVIRGDLSRADL